MLDYLKSLIMSKEDKNRLNEKLNEIKVIKIIIDPAKLEEEGKEFDEYLRISAEQYLDIINNFDKYIYVIKIVIKDPANPQGYQFIVSSFNYSESAIYCTSMYIMYGGTDIQRFLYNARIIARYNNNGKIDYADILMEPVNV